MVIHLHQLGSTTVVDRPKLRDGEMDQLLGALTKEATTRNQSRKEQVDKLKKASRILDQMQEFDSYSFTRRK